MALSIKQRTLFDLMLRSDKIMREHDIQYLLFGGSTLGALRHEGFIPWDDDIDIFMDSKNFYKMMEVFKDGPIDDIELTYFHNDPEWYRSFAMLVSTRDTCYTTPVIYSTGKATGSRIDVMICDYVPEARLEEYRKDLMLYDEVLIDSMFINLDVYKEKKEYFDLRERIEKEGKVAVEAELRKKLEAYAESENDELVVRFWTKELRHYPREVLFPPRYHKFEEALLPIPAEPQQQLRMQYGNDWYMIPAQDDFFHHAFSDNFFISGYNYHEDVVRFIDMKTSKEAIRKRKEEVINRAELDKKIKSFRKELVLQRELIRANFSKNSDDYKMLFADKQYEEYCDRLSPLYKALASCEEVSVEHKSIPIEVLKDWLKSMIICGKYYNAIKLVNWYELQENDTYTEEADLVNRVELLANSYQDCNVMEMEKRMMSFSDEESEKIPECIFCINKLRQEGHLAISAEELVKKCDKYLSIVKNNYEVMKVKADLIYETGNPSVAMALYEQIHANTTNGLDLFDIEKRFNFNPRFEREEEEPLDYMLRI